MDKTRVIITTKSGPGGCNGTHCELSTNHASLICAHARLHSWALLFPKAPPLPLANELPQSSVGSNGGAYQPSASAALLTDPDGSDGSRVLE